MPIYLEAPPFDPRGPDGQGRNRLRVDGIDPAPRCALRPRSFPTLRESQNTLLAAWSGQFGRCTNQGKCSTCSLVSRRFSLPEGDPKFVIRQDANGSLHYTTDLAAGWNAVLTPLDWDDLASLEDGWLFSRAKRDQHGEFITVTRV